MPFSERSHPVLADGTWRPRWKRDAHVRTRDINPINLPRLRRCDRSTRSDGSCRCKSSAAERRRDREKCAERAWPILEQTVYPVFHTSERFHVDYWEWSVWMINGLPTIINHFITLTNLKSLFELRSSFISHYFYRDTSSLETLFSKITKIFINYQLFYLYKNSKNTCVTGTFFCSKTLKRDCLRQRENPVASQSASRPAGLTRSPPDDLLRQIEWTAIRSRRSKALRSRTTSCFVLPASSFLNSRYKATEERGEDRMNATSVNPFVPTLHHANVLFLHLQYHTSKYPIFPESVWQKI